MNIPSRLRFRHAPSALAYMVRAAATRRRRGLAPAPPPLGAEWAGHAVQGAPLEAFLALTGLAEHPTWPLLYPHAAAFRLPMALVADRAFPLPLWNALQIRSRLVLHQLFDRGAILDFSARIAAQRVVAKGVEFDLEVTARSNEALVWSGTSTFYYRGRFGPAGEAAPQAAAPRVGEAATLHWAIAPGGALRCGWLTGDYNPIHFSDRYARRLGFRGAFRHAQRVLGECLARLPRPMAALPLQLDVWLKGPVYYGAEVVLRFSDTHDALTFALHVEDEPRPAVVGCLRGLPEVRYTRRPA